MVKKENKEHTPTSKIIGLLVAIIVLFVIIYAMGLIAISTFKALEVGLTIDFTPLNTLVGGALALAAAYVGFYINMAKSEHIEDKKNEIMREIRRIEEDGITTEEEIELENLKEDLEELNNDLEEIKEEDSQIDIKTFL
jgi:uncharacterized membrane protein (DUF106 family)